MADKNIYLVASYVARPKNPMMTAQKGYMSNPDNVHWDEQVFIAKGMRDKYLRSHVVINLTEEKVVKNSFRNEQSFDDIFKHFYEGYAEYIDESVKKLNDISGN